MTISIFSRIRNAMIGLSVLICALFSGLLFLLLYIVEDEVFVKQIKSAQASYEKSGFSPSWTPSNGNMQKITLPANLPDFLPPKLKENIAQQYGVHEYFDDEKAIFIAHAFRSDTNESYFLTFDVSDLLAVRDTTTTLMLLILLLVLFIVIASVFLAHRLTKSTLAPVRKFTNDLQSGDIDDVVIEFAHQFSKDEIGVLTHELALALERMRDSVRREHEFNQGVSHELRSPIQVAKSATELLSLACDPDDKRLQKPLGRLTRSIAEMNQVVEAFLWVSSDRRAEDIDASTNSAKPSHTCSVEKILAALNSFDAFEPSIVVSFDAELTETYEYPLPASVLIIIVRSLVKSAITHSAEGSIEITLSKGKLSVKNLLNSEATSSSGFGIGLTIVKRLCERFSCDLKVYNNENSVFLVEVVIPLHLS